MKANEIGNGTRSGGRSSISSPAAIAPPISASATHFVPDPPARRPARPRRFRRAVRLTWMNRLTPEPPDPRRGLRDRRNRYPPRAARPSTRARRPRDPRRTLAAAFDRRDRARRRTCVELRPRAVAKLVEGGLLVIARRYERVDVIASNASATWMIAGSSSPVAARRLQSQLRSSCRRRRERGSRCDGGVRRRRTRVASHVRTPPR